MTLGRSDKKKVPHTPRANSKNVLIGANVSAYRGLHHTARDLCPTHLMGGVRQLQLKALVVALQERGLLVGLVSLLLQPLHLL